MNSLYFKDSDYLKKEQWKLLLKQLKYARQYSPFYGKTFQKEGIEVDSIRTYQDFKKIPITTKEDLQLYNEDFISVPKDEIIDHVTTSGTLGKPVSFALNETDLQRLAENEYQSFVMAGITKSSTVQITTTLDRRFMAGMAYFLGLRKLGAGVIRVGSGNPQLQWESINRFKPQYLVAVPSFLLKLIDYARENNIDYSASSVKAAICIGEPLRNKDLNLNVLGSKIEQLWDIELFSTYASTEMSTAFTECSYHNGNHVLSDLIYTEILDTQRKPVNPGEVGELVVTPLGTQTMPLLRYATGDMLTYFDSPCNCGRNTFRLSPVLGRMKQMIKFKGTSVYPQAVIDILNGINNLPSFVIEVFKNETEMDELQILVPDTITTETINKIKKFLQSGLQVTPHIAKRKLTEIEALKFSNTSRKPQIFRDLR